jgi:hypothetical protein
MNGTLLLCGGDVKTRVAQGCRTRLSRFILIAFIHFGGSMVKPLARRRAR